MENGFGSAFGQSKYQFQSKYSNWINCSILGAAHYSADLKLIISLNHRNSRSFLKICWNHFRIKSDRVGILCCWCCRSALTVSDVCSPCIQFTEANNIGRFVITERNERKLAEEQNVQLCGSMEDQCDSGDDDVRLGWSGLLLWTLKCLVEWCADPVMKWGSWTVSGLDEEYESEWLVMHKPLCSGFSLPNSIC